MLHLVIENMSCGGCAKGVTNAIKNVAPTAAVEIQLATRNVTVRGAANPAKVLQALKGSGFHAKTLDGIAE